MARILRTELPDGYFHLTANAVHETWLFCDGDDFRAFIALLTQGSKRWGLGLHAYCLMGTHYHALVDARIEDLSPAMQWIQSHYAREHNARFGRKGALFRQRFSSWVDPRRGALREHALTTSSTTPCAQASSSAGRTGRGALSDPQANICSPMTARLNWPVMAQDELVVHGAREHNLKDVTVRLPRHKLICVTGLSGSGKSSLAFDTIYAEGQRRYVESLSAYARQFLQMMEKPDVDSIDGLSPAISIDQKTTSRNPRSTVGTVTEIYDYLRLLYARVGRPHCPICGRPIAGQSIEAIVDQILQLPEGTRFTVNAPVVRDRKGEYRELFEEFRRDGFTRVKVDGEQRLLEDEITLDKKFKHTIEVVVDRLRMKAELRSRLFQSVETAVNLAEGLVVIDLLDEEKELTFSERFACPEHGVSLPELQPRIFSFNSPHGACPRCTGLGAQQEIDPDLLVPDPTVPLAEALVPLNGNWYEAVSRRSPTATRSTWTRRGRTSPKSSRTSSSTARRASGSTSATGTGWAGSGRTCSRSKASSRTSSAATARPTRRRCGSGSRST